METAMISTTNQPAEGDEEVTLQKEGFLATGATQYSAGGATIANRFTTPFSA